ncbi:hypothetical protein FRC00_007926, partial [Tulasnella sp. 408]
YKNQDLARRLPKLKSAVQPKVVREKPLAIVYVAKGQTVRGHRPVVGHNRIAPRTKNQEATYPIVIVLVARHHTPVPDHTFNLSQRISGQIRCFVAFRERTPIDEIVSDPMAHPIQAEKVWTFENAIPNSRGQIQVAEEERKRLCFGCPMPDPEVRIVER